MRAKQSPARSAGPEGQEPIFNSQFLSLFLRRSHAALHFFGRDVLNVGGNGPAMSEWVLQKSAAAAVELVLQRFDDLGADRDSPLERGVSVFPVSQQARRPPPQHLRPALAHS